MTNILKVLCGILIMITITGCSSENDTTKQPKKSEKETPVVAVQKEKSNIDTSVFAYAKSVDVADSRDITQHIDLVVHMSEDAAPAIATQHAFRQTYDFLQQSDIKGAKTVTIGVMVGEFRVAQITVDTSKFKAGENYIKSVMQASKIDKMNPEVKEYGKSAQYW